MYIDVTEEIYLNQIEQRRIQKPERAIPDTKEMFEQMFSANNKKITLRDLTEI